MRKTVRLVVASLAAMIATPAAVRAATPAGDVTVLTIIDVVPNYAMPQNVETSSALLDKLAQDSQHLPGLTTFKILHDPSRSNHFVILGVWKDMQSFEAYSGAETTRQFRQAFQPRQGGPFDERVYVDLK